MRGSAVLKVKIGTKDYRKALSLMGKILKLGGWVDYAQDGKYVNITMTYP